MNSNSEQQEAILHKNGPAMILAGPGSGKTFVITERIAHLIFSEQISPYHILVITFTRAAADEMKARFLARAGEQETAVTFGTFHAVFYKILRTAYHLGSGAVLAPEMRISWLRELLYADEEAPEDPDFLPSLAEAISAVKGNGLDPAEHELSGFSKAQFLRIYQAYNERLRRENMLDFEDMMLLVLELFRREPQTLKFWQERFRYILVDEFQDINSLQYAVVRLLAAPEDNLFIVGDDDQSIYRFRGAKPEIMLQFPKDYPAARQILLKTCYRFTPEILDSAENLISHNRTRYAKQLKAVRESGPRPLLLSFDSREKQYQEIRESVTRLHAAGIPYKEMALLCRTNFHAAQMVSSLVRAEIPFTVKEQLPDLYSHFIARDLMAYLALAAGSDARADYLQIMNKPTRYMSRKAFPHEKVDPDELREFYRDKAYMQDILDRLDYDLRLLRKMRPFAAIQYIRTKMGYDAYLKQYADLKHLDADDLLEIADRVQEESGPEASLAAWKSSIEKNRRLLRMLREEREPKEDRLVIATMHGAKGLEFSAVFLPDLNDGIVPHRKAVTKEDIEEERRLLYVAMTRAKYFLWMGWLKSRRGSREEPSRFLKECLKR